MVMSMCLTPDRVNMLMSMLQFSFENSMLRLESGSGLARAHDSCKAEISEDDAASSSSFANLMLPHAASMKYFLRI